MEITKQWIEQLTDYYFVYHRGVMYYNQGRVITLNVNKESDYVHIQSVVKGTMSYITQIKIISLDDVEYRCTCPANQSYSGACKHIVATLLAYQKEQSAETKVEERGRSGHHVIDDLVATYERRYDNDPKAILMEQKATIVPYVGWIYDKLYLRFTVGHERQYVISDIGRFVKNFLFREEVTYGKYLTLTHQISQFTASSRPIVEFLLKHFDQSEQPGYVERRYFVLENKMIDAFFEWFKGKRILFDEKGGELSVSQEQPRLTLTIDQDNYGNFLVSFEGMIDDLISTEIAMYLIFDDTLYRLDQRYYRVVGPLLEVLEKHVSLKLSKQEFKRFYSYVLSEVKDFVNIQMDESIKQSFESIKPQAKLYLDMPIRSRIVGTLMFEYQGQAIDPFSGEHADIRNPREEVKQFSQLRDYFQFDQQGNFFYIDDEDMMFRLYQEGIEDLNRTMTVYASDDFYRKIRTTPQVKLQMSYQQSLLNLQIDSPDLPLSEIKAVLDSYKKRKAYHRLKDGTFINIEDPLFSDLDHIFSVLDLSDRELIDQDGHFEMPLSRAFYLNRIIGDSKSIEHSVDPDLKQMIQQLFDQTSTDITKPIGFRGNLRPYQKDGVKWLLTLTKYGLGGILADDMGLGKTIQVIALLTHIYEQSTKQLPTLIVTPASLVFNWDHELRQFAPNLSVLPIIGSIDEREELLQSIPNHQVIITSYDYLKRDIDKYSDFEFMYTIIDEAQYIKNHQTQNAHAVKQIKSWVRFALTGTPIENRLSELWSIFDFILPGYLYTYHYFSKHYEKPIYNEQDQAITNRLRQMVRPFILRRTKQEVLKDLPEKVETVVYVKFDEEQRKIYQSNLALLRSDLQEKIEGSGLQSQRILILSMLTRLRQLCCHPSLYYDNYEGKSAKLEACMDLIENSIASNHKILLFSQFTGMLDLIKQELEARDITYFILQGSTPKEERIRLVERFNQDDTSVFLISLKAGGTGLNLTSADIVIHYDPWWNISVQNQATDRSHRIGQTETVNVYKLIAKNTIEEKILKMQELKQQLSDEIISSEDGIITQMSEEELLKLFED